MKIGKWFVVVMMIVLVGCTQTTMVPPTMKVGLLLEDTIEDQGWNSKGYQGLLTIHANMGIDVVFKEDVKTKQAIENAVKEFEKEGVRLLFGHGRIYAEEFTALADAFPSIHFVSFNGEVAGDNVTSLQFNGYSMGFFAGLVAAAMSETGHVGVIAAYPWQPEIEGFQDGAEQWNERVDIHRKYVESWIDEERALLYFDELNQEKVDVFYPIGDGYHVAVIEKAKEEGLFVIGYVSDQSDLGESTVLTSTVQHVDQLYELIARQYMDGELPAGNVSYDFQDEVISLGRFSPEVPNEIKQEIEEAINTYMESGELPTESATANMNK